MELENVNTTNDVDYIPTPDEQYIDTSDLDIFNQLDDIIIETKQDESEDDNLVSQDELDDITGYNADDDDVSDDFDMSNIAELKENEILEVDWSNVPDNVILFGETTKGEIQEAVKAKEDYSAYNAEFNNFKSQVEKDYQGINEALTNSMSYLDIALNTQKHKYQNAVTDAELAAAARQIKMLESEKEKVAAYSKQALDGVESIKQQVRKQEMINFAQDARREFGSNWAQELDSIADGLSPDLQNVLKQSPSVEIFNLIKDAKAHRNKMQANKQAVKKAASKAKSARSISANGKGSANVKTNRDKIANKLSQGYVSDSDVFAALED